MELSQGRLPFKLEIVKPEQATMVTAYAGLPLMVETLRAVLRKRDYRRLAKTLGYRGCKVARRHLESILVLVAGGGECIDDLSTLRADPGLEKLLGFELSSPTQAKDFLYRFHQDEDGRPLGDEDDAELSKAGRAQIRPEGPGLRALGEICGRVVAQLQGHRTRERATLDVDATIVEAHKREALLAYEGTVGYQPQMAWWAEQGIFLADQFRDGNVPAAYEVRSYLEWVFGLLPASVKERRLRADSALYSEAALTWADEQGIEFAVSADMSPELAKVVSAVPEDAWKPSRKLGHDDRKIVDEDREWAEVSFVPEWARNLKKNGEPFRYLAIRVRSRQRDLLEPDEQRWRHFAVVTNMAWDGNRLLWWHREKQGTVEHGHRLLKDDLAAGTLPCGRFGANAAWWRLNVLVQDVQQLLKVQALPSRMEALRPKALRFRLFNVAGEIYRHSRQIFLRLTDALPCASIYADARRALLELGRPASPAAG